ncbi:hypothetical protein FH972_012839 [Carpinus fangiana]|uniref:F-box domain-containing protein n=1 Tax=Carpinus fangiana TaxID=176857 RepID=A0A5N6R8D2_9ROSI|nr:hypothetical protein FH972_012839 [Carpinus fangiana]
MESDWACLPEDLLVLILDRLVKPSDYVRFSVVYMPWHNIALENYDEERRLKTFHASTFATIFNSHLSI